MAEIKVSQLTEANSVGDNDLLMIVQDGTNKKVAKSTIANSIVESGTNYVKYSDGTLICYENNNNPATENADYWSWCRRIDHWNVTFPVQFISPPSITASGTYQAIISVVTSNLSETGVTITLLTNSTSSSSNCRRNYIAIGKWK